MINKDKFLKYFKNKAVSCKEDMFVINNLIFNSGVNEFLKQ